MYKIINDADLPFDQTSLSLIDIHSRGVDKAYMMKKSAMMTDTISKIRPDPNHSFIHLIAMGAGDYYGANRNGDWFNETSKIHTAPEPAEGCCADIVLGGGLKQYHHTFKSNANVYREHANKDVSKRRGTVEDSAYNDIMRRVELVVKVDNNICHDALDKISKQEQIFYSMACVVPNDICSICHNKASTPAQYCVHIKTMLNRVMKTGHKVVMINDKPNFFDISFVLVPADRIAGTLRKIASGIAQAKSIYAPLSVFLSSPDHIVSTKASTLKKLADIEKDVESNISGILGTECPSGLPTDDLPEDFMSDLCSCSDPMDAIKGLNDKRIMLSLPDFLRLVLKGQMHDVKDDIPSALTSLPTLFNDLAEGDDLDEILGRDEFDKTIESNGCDSKMTIPRDIMSSFSLAPEPMKHRTIVISVRGGPIKRSSWRRSGVITKRGSFLAKEYARYAISFASGGSSLDRSMLVMHNKL